MSSSITKLNEKELLKELNLITFSLWHYSPKCSYFLNISQWLSGKRNPPGMQKPQETWVQSFGPGRYPGGGNGNPLQYSCLGNLIDREVWQAAVCGVAKNQTWLKLLRMHTCIVDIKFRFVIYFHLIHLSIYVNLHLTHIPAKEHCCKERKKNWGWHFIVWLKHIVLFHLKVGPLVLRWIFYL